MARGEDGSLGPIPGALRRRLQSVDELNQDPRVVGLALLPSHPFVVAFPGTHPCTGWVCRVAPRSARTEGAISPVLL